MPHQKLRTSLFFKTVGECNELISVRLVFHASIRRWIISFWELKVHVNIAFWMPWPVYLSRTAKHLETMRSATPTLYHCSTPTTPIGFIFLHLWLLWQCRLKYCSLNVWFFISYRYVTSSHIFLVSYLLVYYGQILSKHRHVCTHRKTCIEKPRTWTCFSILQKLGLTYMKKLLSVSSGQMATFKLWNSMVESGWMVSKVWHVSVWNIQVKMIDIYLDHWCWVVWNSWTIWFWLPNNLYQCI